MPARPPSRYLDVGHIARRAIHLRSLRESARKANGISLEAFARQEAAVHHGISCDRSGMCPIVGTRYHLPGQNYDLCQAEWDKLPPQEQATYERIERPVSLAFDKRVLLLVLLALY